MSRKYLAAPFLIWIFAGTIIPLIMIMYYGLTDRTGALTVSNLLAIFQPVHLQALSLSFVLAFISTLICVI